MSTIRMQQSYQNLAFKSSCMVIEKILDGKHWKGRPVNCPQQSHIKKLHTDYALVLACICKIFLRFSKHSVTNVSIV
uniref:Uncharacterized protein n=1 Tax=Rhizophora mucronata TaxID=61149 RepID=A0A2P2KCL3_RHIMU